MARQCRAMSAGIAGTDEARQQPMRKKDQIMEHSHQTRELYLFAINDGDLYRQQRESIEKNLQKRFDAGTYDRNKAVKLWTYFANNAAKKYHKDFYGTITARRHSRCGNGKWYQMFSVMDRLNMAILCEEEHFELMQVRAD